jgi:hypothetical protein
MCDTIERRIPSIPGQYSITIREKADQMPHFRRTFIIIIGVGMFLAVVIAEVRYATGEGRFFYQAKFTGFSVCRGPDPTTGFPQESVNRLRSSAETIYACGHLQAFGFEPLHFLLLYEKKPTGWFDPTENYRTGYVFKQVWTPRQIGV